jgi:hypothetical protein
MRPSLPGSPLSSIQRLLNADFVVRIAARVAHPEEAN